MATPTNKGQSKVKRTRGKEESFVAIPSRKRQRGRPDEYDPRLLDSVRYLAWAGATDFEIAEAIGVSVVTLIKWQAAHPDFVKALNSARDGYDDRIERTLAARAMGYRYEAEKIHVSSEGVVTRVPYVHHEPPNVTAMIFWLKNRRPHRWREQTDLSLGGTLRHEGKVEHEVTDAPTSERSLALAVLALVREAAEKPVSLDDITTIEGEPHELGDPGAVPDDGAAAEPRQAGEDGPDRRAEAVRSRRGRERVPGNRGGFLRDL